MALLPPVVASLIADTKGFTASMDAAQAKMAETSAKGSGAFSGLQNVGKVALLGIAAGAIAVGAISLKMGTDFQSSMTLLVTGAGEAESNMQTVSDGILAMAGKVGQTPAELAKGMYLIESAGFHGAAGLQVLQAAAEGAKVGNADMGVVAGAVTSVLHDYGMSASNASGATSMLIATVASGKTNLGDLSGALSKVLPIASNLHIPFEQVGAAIATMTNAGAPAADAATYLKQTLGSLIGPSAAGAKALDSIGLSSKTVASEMASGDLKGALANISDAIGKKFPQSAAVMNAEMAKVKAGTETADQAMNNLSGGGGAQAFAVLKNIAGSTKTMQGLLMLTGPHLKEFEGNIAGIGAAGKSTSGDVQGFAKVQQDLGFQVDQAKASLAAMSTHLGLVLIPIVQQVVAVGGKMLSFFAQNTQVALIVAAAIAGPLAIAIGAYILSMIAAAAATVIAMAPIIAIIAAIAALSAGLVYAYTHFEGFRNVVSTVISTVLKIVAGLISWVKTEWPVFQKGIATTILWLQANVLPIIKTVFGGISTVVGGVVGFIKQEWPQVVQIFHEVADNIKIILAVMFLPLTLTLAAAYLIWTHFHDQVMAVAKFAWGFLSGYIGFVFTLIKDIVQTGINVIKDVIVLVLDVLTGKWGKIWGDIKDLLGTVIGGIIRLLGDSWGKILGAIASFIGTVLGFFASLPGKVVPLIMDLLSAIGAELGKLPEQIGEVLGYAIGTLIKWGVDIVTWAVTAIPNFIGTVIGFLLALPGNIWNIWVDVDNKLIQWVAGAIRWAAGAIPGFIGSILTEFQKLPGQVTAVGSDVVHFLWNAITGLGGWIGGMVKGFGHGLIDWLSSLPGDMAGVGKSVVQGIWNGISGAAGWIAQQIAGFAGGLVKGAMAAITGHSPSRLFADTVGKSIGQGIGVGIVEQTGFAKASMGTFLDSLTTVATPSVAPMVAGASATAAQSASAASAASGGTQRPINVTYNIPVTGDVSPQTVAYMKTMLAQHNQELVTTLSAMR